MQVIKNTLLSVSFRAGSLLRPNCKPQRLEWHVQPLDSVATDTTGPATLQPAFDRCFQHQKPRRQTHSTKHPIQLLRNACQEHPADSSWSIFWVIYTVAPLLFTLEPLESPLWQCLLLDLLHTAGGSSTSNLQSNSSTPRFHGRTTRFLLSSVLVCNVCLPDVVFWFGAYSRNNAVTCKNRKWTQSYQLPWTCPVQSCHSTTAVTQQHEFRAKFWLNAHFCPPQSCELIAFQALNICCFKHEVVWIWRYSTWEHEELSCSSPAHPAPWFWGSLHFTDLISREEAREGQQAVQQPGTSSPGTSTVSPPALGLEGKEKAPGAKQPVPEHTLHKTSATTLCSDGI